MAPSYLGVQVRSSAEREADEKAADDTLGLIEQAELELIDFVGQWAAKYEAKLHVDRGALWLIDDICADFFYSERQEALDESGCDTSKRSEFIARLTTPRPAWE